MKRMFALTLIVILFSLIFAMPVLAASPGQEVMPLDIKAFLQWLIGGGGSILAVSWLLERMAWFQKLGPNQKDYTVFGLAAVVGCGALAIVMYAPVAVLDAIAPFFLVISSIFVTVFIAKVFHKADKTNK